MAQVLVDTLCVLPKVGPGHFSIRFPHTFLWWCVAVHWNRITLFYCSGYVQWSLVSSNRRVGTRKTGILPPQWKETVEIYSYVETSCISNICINYDYDTNGMGHTSSGIWFENVASKIIVGDVLLYERTAEQLLYYFRTVLGVLKQHCTTLKLKNWKLFQDRCKFVGVDTAESVTQPL